MNSDLSPENEASGTPTPPAKKIPTPRLIGKDPNFPAVQYTSQSVPKQPTPLSPFPTTLSPPTPSPQSSSAKVQLPVSGEAPARKETSRVKLPLADQLEESAHSEPPARKETSRVKLPLAEQLKDSTPDPALRKETSRVPLPLADQLKEQEDSSEPPARKETSRVSLPMAEQLDSSDEAPPAKKETARVKLNLSDQVRDQEEAEPPTIPSPADSKLSDAPAPTKQPAELKPPVLSKPIPRAPQPPSASSTLNKPTGDAITPVVPKQPPVETNEEPAKEAADTPAEAPAKTKRLLSLDALRGFDMFWIIGGAALLRAIANWSGNEEFIKHATEQTKHAAWAGFTAYDLIFPLFIFISGVTIPYAITSKIANGSLSKPRAYFRVLRRFILLTALGLSFTFLSFDPEQFRIPGVLQLIAGAYLIAAVIAIHRPVKAQLIWALGILIGYWLALTFIPIPGSEAGNLTPSGNLAAYLDRMLPGQLYMGVFDPEGPVRFLPAAAMALLGAVTGSLLQAQEKANHGVFLKLLLAGLVAGGLGWAWSLVFPMIKPLWTSSYVLFAAGCSLVLLSLFYLVIDVWRQRWLGYLWLPIGMNAITIYVLIQFVSFRTISENILGGYAGTLPEFPAEFTLALGVIVLEWILLFYLFRKKTFLRA